VLDSEEGGEGGSYWALGCHSGERDMCSLRWKWMYEITWRKNNVYSGEEELYGVSALSGVILAAVGVGKSGRAEVPQFRTAASLCHVKDYITQVPRIFRHSLQSIYLSA